MQSLFSVTNNVSLISITVTPGTFLAVVALLLCFLTLYIPVVPHIRLPRVSLPRSLLQQSSSHGAGSSESLSSSVTLVHGATTASPRSSSALAAAAAATSTGRHRLQKVLPALPAPPPPRARGALPAPPSLIEKLTPARQLALPEFLSSYWGGRSHTTTRRDITPPAPAPPPKHDTFTTTHHSSSSSSSRKSYVSRDHSRNRRRSSSGRFAAGLRTAQQPHDHGHLALVDPAVFGPPQRQRGRDDGRGGGASGAGQPPRRGLGRGLRRWWLLTTGVAEARQRRPQQRLLEGPA